MIITRGQGEESEETVGTEGKSFIRRGPAAFHFFVFFVSSIYDVHVASTTASKPL